MIFYAEDRAKTAKNKTIIPSFIFIKFERIIYSDKQLYFFG